MSDKIESVVGYTDKSIFVVQINQPMLYHTRMILVIPPMGEMENGFVQWANKMLLLAKELNLKILAFCEASTYKELTKIDGYLNHSQTRKRKRLSGLCIGQKRFNFVF